MFGLPIPEPLVKALAYALMALALLLVGRQWGASSTYEKWIAANEEAAGAAVRIVQKQNIVTEKIVTEYRDRIVQVAGVNTTIEREVEKYVEGKPLTLACMLDQRWLQLHDAAATGAVPAPASGSDGAASGVTAAQALGTVTGNYGSYQVVATRLKALQAWVRQQFEATNGEALTP